jgi:uncharacterized protein YndB with AHSA1/START domain
MPRYAFTTHWLFNAAIERVFAEIEAADQWPSFWRGVQRVEVLHRAPDGQPGSRSRNTWRSALPYDLTFDAEVIAFERPHSIVVKAEGELTGEGRWELRREGSGTRVTYHWNVETRRPWMNLLAPLLRPLFAWNHDVVMGWGYEGFRKRLEAQMGTIDPIRSA